MDINVTYKKLDDEDMPTSDELDILIESDDLEIINVYDLYCADD